MFGYLDKKCVGKAGHIGCCVLPRLRGRASTHVCDNLLVGRGGVGEKAIESYVVLGLRNVPRAKTYLVVEIGMEEDPSNPVC